VIYFLLKQSLHCQFLNGVYKIKQNFRLVNTYIKTNLILKCYTAQQSFNEYKFYKIHRRIESLYPIDHLCWKLICQSASNKHRNKTGKQKRCNKTGRQKHRTRRKNKRRTETTKSQKTPKRKLKWCETIYLD
jgi:hypothetical protein